MSALSELRSLLHATPCKQGWSAIVAHLSLWPDPEQLVEEALPYVDGALARWPDALRVAPRSWIEVQLRGAPVPALTICRAIELWLSDPLDELVALFSHPFLARITCLQHWWSDEPVGHKLLALLSALPATMPLRELTLRCCGLDGQFVDWFERWPGARRVERLDLFRNGLDAAAALRLLLGRPESLVALNLSEQSPQSGHIAAHMRAMSEALGRLPALRELSLAGLGLEEDALRLLTQNMQSSTLRALDLRDQERLDGFEGLGLASWWAGLASLDLSGNELSTRGAARLCDALRSRSQDASLALDLRGTRLRDRGVEALLPGLPAVSHLDLSGHCGLYGESLKLLAGAAPRGLKGLRIALGHGCDQGLAALAEAELPALETLSVASPMLGEPGVAALLGSSRITGLRELMLYGIWPHHRSVTMVHDQMSAAQAASWRPGAIVESLRSLQTEWVSLPEAALDALFCSPAVRELRCLSMKSSAPVVRYIARSAWLSGLETLALHHSGASTTELNVLCASRELLSLRELRLSAEDVKSTALELLARGDGFPALDRLQLQHVQFKPHTMMMLARSPRLSSLSWLDVDNEHIHRLDVAVFAALLERDDLRPELRAQWEQLWRERVGRAPELLTPAQRTGRLWQIAREVQDAT
jgi:hypothetical protein